MTALDDHLLPKESPCPDDCAFHDACPFDHDKSECDNAARVDDYERLGKQDWERDE